MSIFGPFQTASYFTIILLRIERPPRRIVLQSFVEIVHHQRPLIDQPSVLESTHCTPEVPSPGQTASDLADSAHRVDHTL